MKASLHDRFCCLELAVGFSKQTSVKMSEKQLSGPDIVKLAAQFVEFLEGETEDEEPE